MPRVEASRTRRLGRLARRALDAYDLGVARLSALAVNQNWMYRLDAADGRRFVVRVNRPGMRSVLDIASEMHWLAALGRDTDLLVPLPLADRAAGYVQVLDADDGTPHAISVFSWIDGATVGGTVRPTTARAMGAALGHLQDHADRFRPPATFTESRLSSVWTFGRRPAELAADAPPHPWFPRARAALIDRTAARVQAQIDTLQADRAALRYLHIDLHSANVKRVPGGDGRLALLDFDDSRWAHPVQDVAIALYYLWVRPDGPALWDAFCAGYAAVRGDVPADRATLERLVAGRQVDQLAFVLEARLLADHAMPSWLDRVEERLRVLEAGAGGR
ncbi:MAG: phosphotransferase [Candidatus Eisenbacteria bacterium]